MTLYAISFHNSKDLKLSLTPHKMTKKKTKIECRIMKTFVLSQSIKTFYMHTITEV